MRMMGLGKNYLNFFLEIVFPSRCLLCGELLLPGGNNRCHLCPECKTKLVPIQGKRCMKCSTQLISENEICTRCRTQHYHFTRNYSLFEYRDVIKELLYYYKFKAKQKLAVFFAELIYPYLKTMEERSIIIPIPSRRRNVRKRGWDQIKTIGRILQNHYKLPVHFCLKRRGGLAQKELNIEDRFKNIYGKIVCKPLDRLKGVQKAILLDDIFTTGATANECARVLLNQGVKEVSVFTIALD
jgi:competence protein ComFC